MHHSRTNNDVVCCEDKEAPKPRKSVDLVPRYRVDSVLKLHLKKQLTQLSCQYLPFSASIGFHRIPMTMLLEAQSHHMICKWAIIPNQAGDNWQSKWRRVQKKIKHRQVFFMVIRLDQDQWSRSVWIMVHPRNRWIYSGHGFTGSFDAPSSRQILDH